ncbi:MAG: acyltransferase domain-containing protein [Desmonostoc geniculatum HA4340-LM1]|jgi:acyl transferase domain-containing protein/surfactin synthase thioesterase subunit|nr:acyltransferase domain-containing protein [Desmonostoc geniculatum HA4340-LM1]
MTHTSATPDNLSLMKNALQELRAMKAKLNSMQEAQTEPIAIVGMGCRFPSGANSPEAFWQLLESGVDGITEVPPERWDIDAYYEPNFDVPGKIYTRCGGFLTQKIDEFDANFFGISPREATMIDPQQRLLLEVSWEAIEQAGLSSVGLRGSQTGVFIGMMTQDYAHLTQQTNLIDLHTGTGNAISVAAGRLSYLLGFHGPTLTVDTACASSLVAVHLACQSLRNQECNLALAGGVNLMLTPLVSIMESRAQMLSSKGRCKTFDASADGYVRGEGCGVILLKRLSTALADQDNILGLIRGSAVNHDGSSSGLTVPNQIAQEQLLRQALVNARVEPAQISYIEAHGTGTSLGDPIELGALTTVFGKNRSSQDPLVVGSVKTNIGHLEGAAGIAGLIKVILSLQHQQIPPHLHFQTPNPHVDWQESPVTIPTQRLPWVTGKQQRLAGVSSFGLNGTNAHIVLEEAPVAQPIESKVDRPVHLFTLSAKTASALTQLAHKYQNYLDTNADLSLGDLCWTTNISRSHFAHRFCAIADSPQQLGKHLAALTGDQSPAEVLQGYVEDKKFPKTAFLFTGQGSQYVGMGWELYQTQRTFRATLTYCDQILRPYLDQSLLDILYPAEWQADPTSYGQNPLVNQTVYTQPALFALEYALYQLWQSWGITPTWVMGHSLGEYVAACVAGVFSLEDGLKLVAMRSRLMNAVGQQGAMVTISASLTQVQQTIEPFKDRVAIAAINGVNEIVISGESEAVKKAIAPFVEQGINLKFLKVSQGFHSPLMDQVLEAFHQIATSITYASPQIPVISNITGDVATLEMQTPEYWCRHLRESVKFADGITTLLQKGCEVLIECGPHPVLLGMGRNINHPAADDLLWLPSLRRNTSDWRQLLHSLGELYVQGISINWEGFEADYPRQRRQLPTYPFERSSYWVKTPQNFHSNSLLPVLDQADYIQQLVQQITSTEELPAQEVELFPKLLKLLSKYQQSPQKESLNPQNSKPKVELTLEQLLSTPAEERQQRLTSYFTPLLAQVTGLSIVKLDQQQHLANLGVDSLMAAELRRKIEANFGVIVPVEYLAGLTINKFLAQVLLLIEQKLPTDKQNAPVQRSASRKQKPQRVKTLPSFSEDPQLWIHSKTLNPKAKVRIFCFPYAGAGASVYKDWSSLFPSSIDICPIQLPGRENRWQETPITQLKTLITVFTPLLRPYLDTPFAIFGHSMGALIGFELTQELHRRNWEMPDHLFMSGFCAPQISKPDLPIHKLSEPKFIDALRRFQCTPESVLLHSELMQVFLPILRADFKLLETYFYRQNAALNCPITALGGAADPKVSQQELEQWRQQTISHFSLKLFAGGHLFLNQQANLLAQEICETLLNSSHQLTA